MPKNLKKSGLAKSSFLIASGIFGAVPGLVVLWRGISAPPGYQTIFGGVVEATGVFAILVLLANRRKVQRIAVKRATVFSQWMMGLSLSFLLGYIATFGRCVVSHPTHGSLLFPLWNSGRLQQLVAMAGGSRYAALDRYGEYSIYKAINEMPLYPVPIVATVALMLLCYQGIFTSLALAFGVLGMRNQSDRE